MIDVSLHFQRLQTELTLKAAIVDQAVEKVESMLSALMSNEEQVGDPKTRQEASFDDESDYNDIGDNDHETPSQQSESNIVDLPYRSPLEEVMTWLPSGYLTRNYDSYLDYVEQRRKRQLEKSGR